jgi:hypothetical protein
MELELDRSGDPTGAIVQQDEEGCEQSQLQENTRP